MSELTLGVDIGTSSSKGVLVDSAGQLIAQATREHQPSRPRPGEVEMDAETWWGDFTQIAQELTAATDDPITAVGVSGMGPCVLITDADGVPLRPAILYGVDTRATEQIERLNAELGTATILDETGSELSSQAVGPKLAWLAAHEPDVWRRARRLFMPASWLAYQLTGAYRLDHHSASQSNPLYDPRNLSWHARWADELRGSIELPELGWPGDIAGTVTAEAAAATGLAPGTPVIIGTIDAWTEAISVGAQRVGDLMLMYGTTIFLVATAAEPVRHPALWGTIGALPGTYSLAGGMATGGATTNWLSEITGSDFATLTAEAAAVPAGADGLLMLPYLAGERTPINDPQARGTISGLTLSHTRGALYRAALEATAFGVRHNLEAFAAAGAEPRRIVAVGGGTKSQLWTQIVSDVTGQPQDLTRHTIGASYGAAFLATSAHREVAIDDWNPVVTTVTPGAAQGLYSERYADYRELHRSTVAIQHRLAAAQAGEPSSRQVSTSDLSADDRRSTQGVG